MFNKNNRGAGDGGEDFAAGHDKSQVKGDGLHHHEIHEDEGGGFHSKHTHPDGREEHGDHATYEEARDQMDQNFDHGEPDGDEAEGESEDSGLDMQDPAGSYGRAACD